MDEIAGTLKLLIKSEPEWIKCITSFPTVSTKLTKDELDYYKALSTYKECKSKKTYQIIKKLIQSQRSVHPVWFFILKEYFENDKFIFEEDFIDENDVLNFIVPENFEMVHKIQIISTLKIYYTILTNPKIIKCFLDNKSPFITNYPEFKDVWKYLYFPQIEVREETNHVIDLSYTFIDIMECIHIEINEPHHNEKSDKTKKNKIFFITKNRLIDYYVNKKVRKKENKNITSLNELINDDIPNVVEDIFYKLIENVFDKNNYAGSTLNAFIKDIVDNLSLGLFYSDLKDTSIKKELSWNNFKTKCNLLGIEIDDNFLFVIPKQFKNYKPEEKKKAFNELFYNYTELNTSVLLTEQGYHTYLTALEFKHTEEVYTIKRMYARYCIEYDKLMSLLLKNSKKEQKMLEEYILNKNTSIMTKFEKLQEEMKSFNKILKK